MRNTWLAPTTPPASSAVLDAYVAMVRYLPVGDCRPMLRTAIAMSRGARENSNGGCRPVARIATALTAQHRPAPIAAVPPAALTNATKRLLEAGGGGEIG